MQFNLFLRILLGLRLCFARYRPYLQRLTDFVIVGRDQCVIPVLDTGILGKIAPV